MDTLSKSGPFCRLCLPAGVGVEPLALSQTWLWALSALTHAGVGVEGLVPRTLCGTHTATQLFVPTLSTGTQPSISLTFTLALTLEKKEFNTKSKQILVHSALLYSGFVEYLVVKFWLASADICLTTLLLISVFILSGLILPGCRHFPQRLCVLTVNVKPKWHGLLKKSGC